MTPHWRYYETSTGASPVRKFLADEVPLGDRVEVGAAMADVRNNGLAAARHLRGDIYEVRASGNRVIYRILFATEGKASEVLLALVAINKKTQATPPAAIELAEKRLRDWRKRGGK